jgi:Acyl CoA:acetate/3-ketoacid CoA transferase, alpha subunit
MSDNKQMNLGDAVATLVRDGDCLAVGGFVTNRRPYALVREVIRRQRRGLYIEGGPSGGDIDMLIGAGCVEAIMISYIANSGYTAVGRRFREAVESGTLLFEDFSLDVQTAAYHAAALGVSFAPLANMLGSDLERVWGISREERAKHPKLPREKLVVLEDPFNPGKRVCCIPAPKIDVALLHVQTASPDGTCRLEGASFQDIDIAMAAGRTIVSCENLVSNEEIRREPEKNSLTGLCVDAVVHAPYGAHPSQCLGHYDYDPVIYTEYDKASRTQEEFDAFIGKYVTDCPTHEAYLDRVGASALLRLRVKPGVGYVPGIKNNKS